LFLLIIRKKENIIIEKSLKNKEVGHKIKEKDKEEQEREQEDIEEEEEEKGDKSKRRKNEVLTDDTIIQDDNQYMSNFDEEIHDEL